MARYLFTSDLRISELPERIQEVAGFVEQGNQVSAYKDKSKENNAATLKYYFNLHKGTETCSQAATNPVFVIRNYILKFQFPNPRTKESLNDSKIEKTLLAPYRVVIRLLNLMASKNGGMAELDIKGILYWIFCNPSVAQNPLYNVDELLRNLIQNEQLDFDDFLNDNLKWNQYERQSREFFTILTYASKCYKINKGKIYFNSNIPEYLNDKDFIEDVISYNKYWIPSVTNDFRQIENEYISYMDTNNTPYTIVDFSDINKDNNIKDDIEVFPFSISTIIQYIQETGLIYTDKLIKRFAFSLMAKRFLILSGLAGSGKTQLALAFANALIEDKKQLCVVSVGADWTNREPLLGFPNALKDDEYVRPESGVLDLLIEANKEENLNKPYFLILDEMNMSYVERYFADFLSVMESGEGISLWKGSENHSVPSYISLPKNLFIIGTINVDETTYMFSPKVLDRANVIEFKISSDEMGNFFKEMKNVDRCSINGKAAGMGADFVNLANVKELDKDDEVVNTLQNFFNELKKVNAEFGYRTATEIFRYIAQAKKNDDTDGKLTNHDILDAAIIQKLLPKLHGSRKKLEPVLAQLWKLCFTEEVHIARENVDKAIYKESADKILRMYEAANANGFTSFAEA